MSDQEDGVPDVAGVAPQAPPPEVLAVGSKILQSIREWYKAEANLYKLDYVLLNRLIGTCMSQYAAVLAVDSGVDKTSYMRSIEILYDGALRDAPKFGE